VRTHTAWRREKPKCQGKASYVSKGRNVPGGWHASDPGASGQPDGRRVASSTLWWTQLGKENRWL